LLQNEQVAQNPEENFLLGVMAITIRLVLLENRGKTKTAKNIFPRNLGKNLILKAVLPDQP
jgi:hypothetical protein